MGFKQSPFPMVSRTSGHASALKKASAAKKTDWAAMQKKSAEKDPRYGKMSAEEYKAEALRQSKSKRETGKWDAMGKYDHKGKKVVKKEEPKKEEVKKEEVKKEEPKKEKVVSKKDQSKKQLKEVKKAELTVEKEKHDIKAGKIDPKRGTKLSRWWHKQRSKRKAKKIAKLDNE